MQSQKFRIAQMLTTNHKDQWCPKWSSLRSHILTSTSSFEHFTRKCGKILKPQENVHNLKHLVFQVTPACSPLPFTRESLPPLPLPRLPLAPRPPLNPPIPSGFGVAFLTSTWWQLKEQTENMTANHAPISQGNLAVKTITHRATR